MAQRILFILTVLVLASGCVQSRYAWNGYDEKLYDYYKSPAESERFMEQLAAIIRDGEPDKRVPPGIYAEYGYQLFERGRFPEASAWFTKEAEKWPESRFFMNKMISLSNRRGNSKPQTPDSVPRSSSTLPAAQGGQP